MSQSVNSLLKKLPSVDALLQEGPLLVLTAHYGHNPVRDAVRSELDQLRRQVSAADAAAVTLIESTDLQEQLCGRIDLHLARQFSNTLQPVFNLTGTIIHTNLGRALLPESAVRVLETVATRPVTLEYELDAARRGDRDTHVEALVCQLTGAEAATVVNNNAAAVLLLLNTLANGKDVLISRGELVEIGGSFRIPDVMQSAGAVLKEVGTTNRTHRKDFVSAITSATGLLMQVHTSNYAIEGFTSAVSLTELAAIGKEHHLPVATDLGSGTLLDLQQFGLPHELTVREVLEQGADLVTFSGDKLLGGPQAGIIAGNKALIAAIKANPLKRALRLDKLILAALAEVLRLYLDPQRLPERLPVLRDLTRPLTDITAQGQRLMSPLQRALAGIAQLSLVDCRSQVGSGAMPRDLLPSKALCIHGLGASDGALQGLAARFRALPIPVIGRIHDGSLLFDLRCLTDEAAFIEQLSQLSRI